MTNKRPRSGKAPAVRILISSPSSRRQMVQETTKHVFIRPDGVRGQLSQQVSHPSREEDIVDLSEVLGPPDDGDDVMEGEDDGFPQFPDVFDMASGDAILDSSSNSHEHQIPENQSTRKPVCLFTHLAVLN
jgi:hypothetical protein